MSRKIGNKNIDVTIVIVHYKVKQKLLECLSSIYSNTKNISFEIVVVDNDEKKTIGKDLKKQFSDVIYIPSPKNVGYGAGVNLGATIAHGKYLFVLNPDTVLLNNSIKLLANFLDNNQKFAVVAPLLHDSENNIFQLQGTQILTPTKAIFSLSFISKIFPNNPIAKKYWLKSWNKKSTIQVGTVPGTAFMVRKNLFDELGGFDRKFFLYFEEHDLSLRILQRNYKIGITPQAKIIHHWGLSTARSNKNIKKIFEKSRYYYFKKHYGIVPAILTEIVLRFGKVQFALALIIILGSFLRYFKIFETFYIIPDGGWFYLSARDLILTGNIPLVGPQTSHPWIHHGPLWTYALALLLFLFNFNPIIPAYFMATLGVATIYVIYKLSSSLFDEKTGIITALLYSSSPLVISNSRNPYHTSPLPFFSLIFFYCVNKWVSTGNTYYVPIISFLIGVLYNHEITTAALSSIFFVVGLYGLRKRTKYIRNLVKNKKIMISSFFSFLVPMTPFILHDLTHGFRQTGGFIVWMLYRLVKLPLSFFQPSTDGSAMTLTNPEFVYFIKSVFFYQNLYLALVLLAISLLSIPLVLLIKKDKNENLSVKVLTVLFLFIPLAGLFTHRVPIEADVMLVAPFLIVSLGYFISTLTKKKYLYVGLICLFVIVFLNIQGYITEQNNKAKVNFIHGEPLQYDASRRIVELSGDLPYNLKGKGVLDNFPVFTMPYEYLTWWMGNGPVKEKVDNEIIVSPQGDRIEVYINEDAKE